MNQGSRSIRGRFMKNTEAKNLVLQSLFYLSCLVSGVLLKICAETVKLVKFFYVQKIFFIIILPFSEHFRKLRLTSITISAKGIPVEFLHGIPW
jgi:hypothetical protein